MGRVKQLAHAPEHVDAETPAATPSMGRKPKARVHPHSFTLTQRQLHGLSYFSGANWHAILAFHLKRPISDEVYRRIVLALPQVGAVGEGE